MKTLDEIYISIRDKFFKKTNIDVERGTAIDYFLLGASEMIKETYDEIDDSRTPHIYTGLRGNKLDEAGILCGIYREQDEDDTSFMFRMINWNTANKAANYTSIESALINLEYSSNATYRPLAFGCSTAAIYVIPKEMTDDYKELAINEVKEKLRDIVSPSTYVEYIVPTIRQIKITCLIKTKASDINNIKSIIENKIIEYVNGIAPGDSLEMGNIIRLIEEDTNILYFNVGHLEVDGSPTSSVSILQKIESKLLISRSDITWLEVE